MTQHELKTWPDFFAEIKSARKQFDLRKNDRDFQIGDTLRLREYEPATEIYTDRVITREVTYIVHGPKWGLEKGFCIMSLKTPPKCFVAHFSRELTRKIKAALCFSISHTLLPAEIVPGDLIAMDDMWEITLFQVIKVGRNERDPLLKPAMFGLSESPNDNQTVSTTLQMLTTSKGSLVKKFGHPIGVLQDSPQWLEDMINQSLSHGKCYRDRAHTASRYLR